MELNGSLKEALAFKETAEWTGAIDDTSPAKDAVG